MCLFGWKRGNLHSFRNIENIIKRSKDKKGNGDLKGIRSYFLVSPLRRIDDAKIGHSGCNMLGQRIVTINTFNESLAQRKFASSTRISKSNIMALLRITLYTKSLIITFDSNYRCDCNERSFLLIIIGRFYSVKKKEEKSWTRDIRKINLKFDYSYSKLN